MASADEGLADVASLVALHSSVLTLFLRLLASEPRVEARRRENNCVYNTAVVMWLMITQRLQAQGLMPHTFCHDCTLRLGNGFALGQTSLGYDGRFFFRGYSLACPM